jgi:secondary thiamine-phosphate synthase enzyme
VTAHHALLSIETTGCFEFIDLTDRIAAHVARSGVYDGIVNVQTQHTTTAIVVNENEPWLLADMRDLLDRIAPRTATYRHNSCPPDSGESVHDNGHAHCKAMLLAGSQVLNVHAGALQLGRWQRIFLLELDRPRQRTVSIMVLGEGCPSGGTAASDR